MAARLTSTPLSIGAALFGRTRQAVLALLFGKAGRSYHVREIVAVSGLGTTQVQRELKRLVECGLLIRTPTENRVLYRANRASPACDYVIRLVVGTFGLADLLRRALSDLDQRIDLAVVVGPAARGKYVGLPLIDLVVVGSLTESELAPALTRVERTLGRRIAVTVLDRGAFAALHMNRQRLTKSSQSAFSTHGPRAARALRALWTERPLVLIRSGQANAKPSRLTSIWETAMLP